MIPTVQITDSGLIVPPRQDIEAWLWQQMREALGANLAQDARTPQGQLVTSLTAAIDAQNNQMVALGNQFDTRYATGIFQEALGAIYFLRRKLAIHSVAQLEFIGIAGTVIPAGFIVLDQAGNRWRVTDDATIGGAPANAECEIAGNIQAAPDTITEPLEQLSGLDRVTNPSAAAAGELEESRVGFEIRRAESVAANSWGMNRSVRSAVAAIDDVIDCYVIDNPRDHSITVGITDYPMIRNSLLVSVVGGDSMAIAEKILRKGGTCCAFVGNTEVIYYDEDTGNVTHPRYEVRFLRPDMINVLFRLTVIDPNGLSYEDEQRVKDHIINELQRGANRGRIGGLVIAANYLCGLSGDSVRPVKLEISTDSGATWHNHIEFGVDQFPVSSPDNVSIVGL